MHITKALGPCRTFHNSQILHEKKCLLTDPIVWRVSVYFQVYLLLRVCTQSLPKSQWFAFFFSKNMELITSLSLSYIYMHLTQNVCIALVSFESIDTIISLPFCIAIDCQGINAQKIMHQQKTSRGFPILGVAFFLQLPKSNSSCSHFYFSILKLCWN